MDVMGANNRGFDWYLRRLLAMSPQELSQRVIRDARHRLDDYEWSLAKPLWRRAWQPEPQSLQDRRLLAAPAGFLTPDRAAGLRVHEPPAVEAILAAAEDALAGRFRFFGYPEVTLERPIDFALDPLTGRRWPPQHGKRLDYRGAEFGDPKWIWELNRCQHLPLLAAAWLLVGDDRFAVCARDDLLGWVRAHPPGRGIAWSNGFEAGLRAISFSLCFDALRGFPNLSAADSQVILRSLWQHARWIRRDPATHSSANNHRVGELAGLATIALLAPDLSDAESWLRDALTGLCVEADRQVLQDGTGAEQAFAYHVFVLDLLLLVVAVLDAREIAVPRPFLDALNRAGDALAQQVGDDEPALTYGDADDARAHRLDGGDLRDVRGTASALAARLGHAGTRRLAGAVDATAWWLFGSDGAERLAGLEPAPRAGSSFLPDSGLALLRRGRLRVTVDIGPLGYLSIAAHGHADALQVTITDRDQELVVDPGVGSYFGNAEWRRAFRGTEFHPTVTVDHRDQSEPRGPFLWGRHARARLLHLDVESGIVAGEHDGYLRLSDPVRHRRVVAVLSEGVVLVYDRLEARGAHRYAQVWPFHPSLDVTQASRRSFHATHRGDMRLVIDLVASAPAHARLARGQERPLAGWWSPRLEMAVPAWTCRWEAEATGPVSFGALIRSPAAGAGWEAKTRLELVAEGVRAIVEEEKIARETVLTLSGDGRPDVVTRSVPVRATVNP